MSKMQGLVGVYMFLGELKASLKNTPGRETEEHITASLTCSIRFLMKVTLY